MEAVHSLLWQLVVEGVIHPALNLPFFTLTEYGRRAVADENAHPHDIERFLDQTRSGHQIDLTVEAYLIESLHSFRQSQLVASAILLGVAAERAFLMIADALLEALKDPSEQAMFKKLLIASL